MKPKVYVETTIVSYLTARGSRDLIVAAHQELTQEWWQRRRGEFELYCSQLVVQEASGGHKEAALRRLQVLRALSLLEINDAAKELAPSLGQGGVHAEKSHGRRTAYCHCNGSWYGLLAYLELQAHCECGDAEVCDGYVPSAGLRTACDLHA